MKQRLLDPTTWLCDTCYSTDGVWVCLECGHAGCSRNATHPELGGGHALHHYLCSACSGCCVFDVVSKAVHCYACDDYVIDEPPRPWLDSLRTQLADLVPQPPPPEHAGSPGKRSPQAPW